MLVKKNCPCDLVIYTPFPPKLVLAHRFLNMSKPAKNRPWIPFPFARPVCVYGALQQTSMFSMPVWIFFKCHVGHHGQARKQVSRKQYGGQ